MHTTDVARSFTAFPLQAHTQQMQFLFGLIVFLCSAGGGTQGLAYAGQVLCHELPPSLEWSSVNLEGPRREVVGTVDWYPEREREKEKGREGVRERENLSK